MSIHSGKIARLPRHLRDELTCVQVSRPDANEVPRQLRFDFVCLVDFVVPRHRSRLEHSIKVNQA